MSLRLWMPLMGDLRNQGLDNFSMSTLGTISWVDGKLGAKALQAGNASQTTNGVSINSNLTDILANEYSVSVWIKPLGNHVHYNGTILSSGDWNHTRWAFGVNQDNTKVDVLSRGHNTYLNCTVPVNEWTNLICTCDSTNRVYLYKNGELIGSGQMSGKPESDANNATIGRETYANGYFSFNGAIQDLRLYDHCLSEMEIKQLSQGLVLHYPLNRQGFGQENLLSGNNAKITTWTNYMSDSVTLSGEGYDNKYTLIKGIGGWEKIFTDAIAVTSGKTYTLSFDYSVEQNYIGYSGQFGLSVCTTSQAKYGADTDVITKVNFGTTKKDKSRTSVTFVATSNTIYLVANGGNISDGQENISFYISYIKLEEGSIATPWCPNSSDTLATTMGLNSNIEYDTSGYCNNGTKNNITYVSDTPKYEVSSVFNGTNSWIKVNENNWAVQGMNEMTVNFWAYSSDWTTRPKLISCTESGGWNTENGNTGYLRFPIHVYTNADKTSTAYRYSSNEIKVSDLEAGWHMITLIYDNTGNKIYIDGHPHSSYAFTSYGIHYNLNARLFLGCEANTASPYTPYLNGSLSDFRIYATALSASDILSLYQNCATIDPDGTIRGQIRS